MNPVKLHRLVQRLFRRSHIMIVILKLEKHLSMGLESYIEGSTTRYDASRYRYGNDLLQWCNGDKNSQEQFRAIALLDL